MSGLIPPEPPPGTREHDEWESYLESIAEDLAYPGPLPPPEAEYEARRAGDAYERWLTSTSP